MAILNILKISLSDIAGSVLSPSMEHTGKYHYTSQLEQK